ncbi:hypothetical protein PsgRace4_03864 [Pseudomonas savastanoi pv. glycinea str. race 4]|nr:hypothetical protein PsgRace4_03864 [Pseudomonas savastanoi pv. glycinea str. race 4]
MTKQTKKARFDGFFVLEQGISLFLLYPDDGFG